MAMPAIRVTSGSAPAPMCSLASSYFGAFGVPAVFDAAPAPGVGAEPPVGVFVAPAAAASVVAAVAAGVPPAAVAVAVAWVVADACSAPDADVLLCREPAPDDVDADGLVVVVVPALASAGDLPPELVVLVVAGWRF